MVIEETTDADAQIWQTAGRKLRPTGRAPCLLDVLRRLGDFKTFLRLADAAQVTEDLAARAPLTVLAPTDAAFADHDVEPLLAPEAAETLCDYVERHLVRGAVVLDEAVDAGVIATVDGASFRVRESDGSVWFERARLDRAPLAARNGVVFVVDRPLFAHMLLAVPVSRPPLTLSELDGPRSRRGPLTGAAGGARALMSLAPSRLQAVRSPRALAEPQGPHHDALDHGRAALLALAPSKLGPVLEPDPTVEPPGCHDRARSG